MKVEFKITADIFSVKVENGNYPPKCYITRA